MEYDAVSMGNRFATFRDRAIHSFPRVENSRIIRPLRRISLQNLKPRSSFTSIINMGFLLYFNLDVGLLARSQYSEVPATDHLDTGFSWFPCVYKQTLRWFPRFHVATTCFSCSPPDLNLLVTNFIFCIHVK